ncbi:MAG: glycine betaine ABC transporter substrate-binding protein [Desulfonatronovibrionaceae bacterium]
MFRKGLILIVLVAMCLAFMPVQSQASKGTVKMSYVEWSCATASTNVAAAIIEEKLDYDVDTMAVSAAAMWQAVASGDVDAMITAWLPVTHKPYYDKLKDDVVNLGQLTTGAKIGLVVPDYVTIDSIEEMKDNADKFDSKIIGIDPGAGIMMKTEEAIDEYDLEGFNLVEGSGATMTAALKDAIRQEEWVAVTGWSPHWKFGRWDLKYLKDPKGVYGGAEDIDKIVRKGLKEDKPEVYDFLKRMQWDLDTMQEVMAWNQEEGADPLENGKRFMKENPELVNKWLGKE